jgi:hypothetical protein
VPPLVQLGSKERWMLWLILGIVLLIIAIAGGAIVHPLLFALAILALLAFFVGARGGSTL